MIYARPCLSSTPAMRAILALAGLTCLAAACLDAQPIDRVDSHATATDTTTTDAPDLSDGNAPDALVTTPCAVVTPTSADFGAVALGQARSLTVTVLNCGEQSITLTRIAFVPGSNAAFTLAVAEPPLPLLLAPQATLTLRLQYSPTALSLVNADGTWDQDEAKLVIEANAATWAEVTLSGHALEQTCPHAIIMVPEGDEVVPQTVLHLIGSQSVAVNGEISSYEWRVEQPAGAMSVFLPSSSVADPNFEMNVAGTYTFRLSVTDSMGVRSCIIAEYVVRVVATAALHVELLWWTPGVAVGTVGADLDLHFLHPAGSDWFDTAHDTYWQSPPPNWGGNATHMPSLDRDDTDGDGPENLNFVYPEDGVRYCVGVHYWDDHGLGTSFATVRIYVYGVLRYEQSDVALDVNDLWEVTCFGWPVSDITTLIDETGGMRISHDYDNPLDKP